MDRLSGGVPRRVHHCRVGSLWDVGSSLLVRMCPAKDHSKRAHAEQRCSSGMQMDAIWFSERVSDIQR